MRPRWFARLRRAPRLSVPSSVPDFTVDGHFVSGRPGRADNLLDVFQGARGILVLSQQHRETMGTVGMLQRRNPWRCGLATICHAGGRLCSRPDRSTWMPTRFHQRRLPAPARVPALPAVSASRRRSGGRPQSCPARETRGAIHATTCGRRPKRRVRASAPRATRSSRIAAASAGSEVGCPMEAVSSIRPANRVPGCLSG